MRVTASSDVYMAVANPTSGFIVDSLLLYTRVWVQNTLNHVKVHALGYGSC